jgi:hypothetical protein
MLANVGKIKEVNNMLITTNEKLKPIVEAMENILNDCIGIHGIFNISRGGA